MLALRRRKRSARDAKICSMPDCAQPPRVGQRYCPECHSTYMRAWRAKRKRAEIKLREDVVRLRKQVHDFKVGQSS